MKRKIVKIDEDKCNGCGLCITACHEGALQLINGKAKLVSDIYCDGLGACLPDCPTDAISLEEREAKAFDEEAVKKHLESTNSKPEKLLCGCPGMHARELNKNNTAKTTVTQSAETLIQNQSELRQWPCQIKLVPANAPYLKNAHLLVAADCTAFAYANIHHDFMRNKITLIGCPKLDNVNYADKLTDILSLNEIKSITVLRMEVPCCSGIAAAVKEALVKSGAVIPWRIITISTDGQILED